MAPSRASTMSIPRLLAMAMTFWTASYVFLSTVTDARSEGPGEHLHGIVGTDDGDDLLHVPRPLGLGREHGAGHAVRDHGPGDRVDGKHRLLVLPAVADQPEGHGDSLG